ncbi:efflux RND transporter periplasmic adaptor subunit [Lysobacter sp. TAB13]|uniref:efflux RND transporter periplasmic adaptor subunit n=1 Tax=Lysobacter sp. TAB13 TaxID=3233065 RepID=UPI003F94B407
MRRRLALSAALCAALPLALAACGGTTSSDPRTQPPLVRVVAVQAPDAASRSFTGIVAARVQSDLGFRVSGKVLERLVDAGQTVRRGQSLMRIDPADLELAVNAQRQAVAAARAQAVQTTQEEVRYRNLLGIGAVSASAYEQAKAAADAAKAQLRAAQAQAEVARNASGYAQLLADGDGTVMQTLAEPGQVVGAGQVVVRLAHAGPREALVQLPETLRPAVGSAGQATLFGKDAVAVATRLRQLSDAADPLTRTFEARYVLEGELANAPLGATVTIQIADGHSGGPSGLQVPVGALFDAGKGPGVWVINDNPAKVAWRPVTVLRVSDEGARVTGRLKQGERIVALGAHLLREGEQVRIAGQPAAAGAAP